MSDLDTLLTRATAWIRTDPDPETRAEAAALVASRDEAALRACFGPRLEFGTAGMRGRLGPGPGRMNRALVRRVSAGLGRHVLAQVADAARRGVVVGYDARRNSRAFAEDTAAVLGGLGLTVWLYEDVAATPELAHAVVFLGAAAGVMVTASHNPPEDNGYKVYWENGAQIIPPHDVRVSAAIDALDGPVVAPALEDLSASGLVRAVPAAAWEDYLRRVLDSRVHGLHPPAQVRAVYTAMHGVGWRPLRAIVAASGHAPLIPVPEQVEPDSRFPTVAFPNPEEPGALDLALALARAEGADLVLANDPDADRLAVAVPDGEGGWRALTGNQVGVLLADDLLTHGTQGPDRLVATTIVSTSLLQRVAAAHGARYGETLTGFKWIANLALSHEGPFIMGFEEALGYTVGRTVRDKDGLSAALVMLDLAAWCKARGRTLLQHLEELYRRYGYVGGQQRSMTLPGLDGAARIAAMMDRLRADPPAALGGVAVRTLRDLSRNTARDLATGEVRGLDLPKSNVLAFDLQDGGRVLARPSGTEPKIKFYVEVALDMGPDETLDEVEARAAARGRELADEVVARATGSAA